MVFDCIKHSQKISFDYTEISQKNTSLPARYDLYVFNYHFSTTGWLDTRSVSLLPGIKGTIVLEILPNDPFVYCSPFDFDFYCVLDPSMKLKHKRVFPFPRPLDHYTGPLSKKVNEIPIIGSFGFATKGKGFEHVVEAVNKEFDEAIVRINIPHGTYTDPSHQYAIELASQCKSIAKKGIEVKVTHDFMSKEELIYWCSENTLNCFLYDRNMPGLAATTDQAITSERPLAVSDNSTFRHITKYIKPYPFISLKESIAQTEETVKKIKMDWAAESFTSLFEAMVQKLSTKASAARDGTVTLKIRNRKSIRYKIEKRVIKLLRFYYKSSLYAAFH